MGLRIRTNTTSINAQRKLQDSTNMLRKTMAKLTSGERINKAADDAAGLAVSESLRADLRSLKMARRTANDGISLVQTTEGGLVETNNVLVRLRELAVQAASDTISDLERGFLDKEFVALKDEIERLAITTEFNGTRLLVGDAELPEELGFSNAYPLEIQVGKDYFPDVDDIERTNPVNIIKLDLRNINAWVEGENSLEIGKHEEGARIHNKADAQQSINVLDQAVDKINTHRAYLGSIQNRLNTTVSNLSIYIENLGEARSRVRDTDFAAETSNLTKANILQNAGTSVLATANSQPQIALSLLNAGN